MATGGEGALLGSSASRRILRLVELPPFRPGIGGIGSADPLLHAEARATLLLLALHAHPVLCESEYADVVINRLEEAHPLANALPERAVAVRPAAGGGVDTTVDISLPLRSDTTRKLLPVAQLRLLLWRALQLSVCGRGERPGPAALEAGAKALEERFCADYLRALPRGVADLVAMRVLRADYAELYRTVRGGGTVGSLLPAAPAPVVAADADSLWWPPCAEAVTHAEAQRLRALQQGASAAAAVDEARRQREERAAAAERRLLGLPSMPAGGASPRPAAARAAAQAQAVAAAWVAPPIDAIGECPMCLAQLPVEDVELHFLTLCPLKDANAAMIR